MSKYFSIEENKSLIALFSLCPYFNDVKDVYHLIGHFFIAYS
jgi:hypothetical protein